MGAVTAFRSCEAAVGVHGSGGISPGKTIGKPGKTIGKPGKTMGKPWENGGLMGFDVFLPLVMTDIAVERSTIFYEKFHNGNFP